MTSESTSFVQAKRVPIGKRLGQLALICVGSTVTISALVNGAAAWWLIQPTDEESLGITRREVLMWCATIFVLGALLLYFGIRSWRSTRVLRRN